VLCNGYRPRAGGFYVGPHNHETVVRNLDEGARRPAAIIRGNNWSEEDFCHAVGIEAPGN
jgi:hypothetical protein